MDPLWIVLGISVILLIASLIYYYSPPKNSLVVLEECNILKSNVENGINIVFIADKEKALVDSLLFPKYAGGIREIINCIETSLNEIELDTLCDYALKVESKAVLRRLGFILEYLKYKGNVIERIRKNIGSGYERLDPSLDKRNNLNKEWLLDINDDIDR